MSSSDDCGLNGLGARSVGSSLLIFSHLSLRCLIAVEVVLHAPPIAMMQSENMSLVITPPSARGVGVGRFFEKHLPPLVEDEMTLDEIM